MARDTGGTDGLVTRGTLMRERERPGWWEWQGAALYLSPPPLPAFLEGYASLSRLPPMIGLPMAEANAATLQARKQSLATMTRRRTVPRDSGTHDGDESPPGPLEAGPEEMDAEVVRQRAIEEAERTDGPLPLSRAKKKKSLPVGGPAHGSLG